MLSSEAVLISRTTYQRTYPMTVGNNARMKTASHMVIERFWSCVINSDERNGMRPSVPRRNA